MIRNNANIACYSCTNSIQSNIVYTMHGHITVR